MPRIHISSAIRDVEMWSNAPDAIPPYVEPPPLSERPDDIAEESVPAVAVSPERDPVFDSFPSREEPSREEPSPEVPEWNRGAWAAALGVGVGALLAWLYRLG